MIRSRVAPLILLASYNKNGHTDAGGHFELHGLPSMEGQLRAIDPRLPIRSGTCLADVKASSGPRIEVSPAVSPGSQVHELLGMKLLEIDSQVQAKLGLAKPYGLLVVIRARAPSAWDSASSRLAIASSPSATRSPA